jgi:hypothetical protein
MKTLYCINVLFKYFPVDYVLMALIILYIYFATLSGITNMGIRFLWIKVRPLFENNIGHYFPT